MFRPCRTFSLSHLKALTDINFTWRNLCPHIHTHTCIQRTISRRFSWTLVVACMSLPALLDHTTMNMLSCLGLNCEATRRCYFPESFKWGMGWVVVGTAHGCLWDAAILPFFCLKRCVLQGLGQHQGAPKKGHSCHRPFHPPISSLLHFEIHPPSPSSSENPAVEAKGCELSVVGTGQTCLPSGTKCNSMSLIFAVLERFCSLKIFGEERLFQRITYEIRDCRKTSCLRINICL